MVVCACRMQETVAHETVVTGGMVFGMVITEIVGARAPVDEKLALAYSILEPIETHVHGFGAFLFDC